LVGEDGAIGGGVSHAGQHVASADLIVIQEGLIRLINGARRDFTSTGRASPGATGVGRIY